jgi:hypothetical protein
MLDAEIGVTSVSVVGSTTGDPAVTSVDAITWFWTIAALSTTGDPAVTSVDAMTWVWLMDALPTTGAPVVILDAVSELAGLAPPILACGLEARGLKPSILRYLKKVL